MRREVKLLDELDSFSRGGEISHALALTFGYDGDTAAERIWTPLIERYGVRHPIVITSGAVDEGAALCVHVLRAPRASGVFHPKLLLAVREDSALVAVGSANLTRGGLGNNLELLTPLVFASGTDRGPSPNVLSDVLGFLEAIGAGLSPHVAPSSRDKVREVIRAARFVLRGLSEPRRAPPLRFFCSYNGSLWPQIVEAHGEDAVHHLAVVSPFFESDDPNLEESDSLLRYALDEGLPWSPRATAPRCSLHVAAIGDGSSLPRAAVEELGSAISLHPQALSVEPRRLHAKLLAIFGKKRTTLVWGSPNFTPAALLRSADAGGNVECALTLTMSAAQVTREAVWEEFDLGSAFFTHRGALPEGCVRRSDPPPVFEIGEALYDAETRELALYGEVWSAGVARLTARIQLGSTWVTLVDVPWSGPGPIHIQVGAAQIEEVDPETGRRRLPSLTLLFEAFDASGLLLAALRGRINVRFEDALELRENLLLGADALSADALLVPTAMTPGARVAAIDHMIALWKAARREGHAEVVRHQASLDSFFRNVRGGLDARIQGLEQRSGSCFALMRWSHDLRRALASATEEEALEPVRRAYLVARVAEHITAVLGAIPTWHKDPTRAHGAVAADELGKALSAVPLGGGGPEIINEAKGARDRALAALKHCEESGAEEA